MKYKITAIGEILFDIYPEYKKLGGAPFNFIYHTWKLMGDANFISRIGEDNDGEEILHYLVKNGFGTKHIQKDKKHNTGVVNVKLDNQKTPSFKIIEDSAYDFIEVNKELIKLAENSDLLYFGSLAQRNETSKKAIYTLAKKTDKVLCDLNIRQTFYNEEIINMSLKLSTIVKLNIDELQLVNALLLKEKFELKKTARNILNKFRLDLLCVTAGSAGAYLFNEDNETHHQVEVKDVVDTVGAGDAFAALMSIGYLSGWKLEKINQLASEFAAEICKVKGAIPEDEDVYNKFVEKINDE